MDMYLVVGLVSLLALCLVFGATLAPYLYPECMSCRPGKRAAVLRERPVMDRGRWFDDYFVIEEIDSGTFAIGEPRYYQGNYTYLLLGKRRAVLYDAGTGTRDIVPVIRSLTSLPITVIPSHLHFDHVGALGRFDRTALLDDPGLRRRAIGDVLTLKRYEFLGLMDDLAPPTFRVDEWWSPDCIVDLGERELRVLSAPGHTSTSVALHDASHGQIFVGDLIYPGLLYGFLPDASRSALLETTRRLLIELDRDTRILAAHMAAPPAPARAPILGVSALRALENTLIGVREGGLTRMGGAGLADSLRYPRVYPVSEAISLGTGYPWNNR